MNLRPKMRLEQEYTDNYFRSEENEADIWVTSVNPGLEFMYFTDESRVDLDYVFSYFWHNEDEDDVDSSDLDYAGHLLLQTHSATLTTGTNTGEIGLNPISTMILLKRGKPGLPIEMNSSTGSRQTPARKILLKTAEFSP
jgi:hypothetical protein